MATGLNFGCGRHPQEGWINADLRKGAGIQITGDIRDGLPLDDDSLDYAASMHALPMIGYQDLVPVLDELRRVLRPGATLRLGLPDLDKGIDAYRRGDASYFLVPDEDERSLGGKFIVHMLWYGWSVTLFTTDFAEAVLRRAGFREVRHCQFGQTASGVQRIVELDNREAESLFVEAVK